MVRYTVKTAPRLRIYLSVAVGLGIGCSKLAPKPANPDGVSTPSDSLNIEKYTANWTRYTSPDGRFSMEYPAAFPPKIRQRTNADDPDVAFFLGDPDSHLQVTVIFSSFEYGPPEGLLESKRTPGAGVQYTPLSSRQALTIDDAKGWRQEFAETTELGVAHYINLVVSNNRDCLHVTIGCTPEVKDKIWPVCERIVQSIRFTNVKP